MQFFSKLKSRFYLISSRILSIRKLHLFALALFLGFAVLGSLHAGNELLIWNQTDSYTVCLDAGHGGDDPGKVSASGLKEKDINLAIALKCKTILEQHNVTVIMTRQEDKSLADPSSGNQKASDLKARKEIMTADSIDCAISIHQNSFPDENQHGAQVFYNGNYEQSKTLAGMLQTELTSIISTENTRQIKENTDYYLLRDNAVPTVIAEVCFLSNPSEAALIQEEDIQKKEAFHLATGILHFLHTLDDDLFVK